MPPLKTPVRPRPIRGPGSTVRQGSTRISKSSGRRTYPK